MKKHLKWLLPLLILVAAIAGWRWYTRPMTLEDLVTDFRWDEVTDVSGSCRSRVSGQWILYEAAGGDAQRTAAAVGLWEDAVLSRRPVGSLGCKRSGIPYEKLDTASDYFGALNFTTRQGRLQLVFSDGRLYLGWADRVEGTTAEGELAGVYVDSAAWQVTGPDLEVLLADTLRIFS